MVVFSNKDIIAVGAEAEIWRGEWNGRDAVMKKRIVKKYRHPELDASIRKERIRKEARLMRGARQAGIPVPLIYDIDELKGVIVMQYFHGARLMDSIQADEEPPLNRVGRYIGKLHQADITHGDLTTSNILYHRDTDSLCFLDFSLGERTTSVEEKGVDLHLMREALVSVHSDPLDKFGSILDGYGETFSGAEETIAKVKDIESRGRYL